MAKPNLSKIHRDFRVTPARRVVRRLMREAMREGGIDRLINAKPGQYRYKLVEEVLKGRNPRAPKLNRADTLRVLHAKPETVNEMLEKEINYERRRRGKPKLGR